MNASVQSLAPSRSMLIPLCEFLQQRQWAILLWQFGYKTEEERKIIDKVLLLSGVYILQMVWKTSPLPLSENLPQILLSVKKEK